MAIIRETYVRTWGVALCAPTAAALGSLVPLSVPRGLVSQIQREGLPGEKASVRWTAASDILQPLNPYMVGMIVSQNVGCTRRSSRAVSCSVTSRRDKKPPRDTRLRSCARSRAETHEFDIARGDHGMGIAPERPNRPLELVDRLGGARGDGACRGRRALPS